MFQDIDNTNIVNQSLRRYQVLFSGKYSWHKHIRLRLNPLRYALFFKNFSEMDLNAFDILIPQHISDIEFLIRHRSELQGKKCFIPPLEALKTCNDKVLFNQFVITHGFGDFIPKTDDGLSFPYILKKRIDEFGSRSRIIKNSAEEKPFRKFIDSDNYYRQEYIAGQDEFTTHMLFIGGQCVFHKTLQFHFTQDFFIKGAGCKPPWGTESVRCSYIKTFTSIMTQMAFEGLCCFNYKLVDGQAKIFEVNPRYGGSLTRFLPEVMDIYIEAIKSNQLSV